MGEFELPRFYCIYKKYPSGLFVVSAGHCRMCKEFDLPALKWPRKLIRLYSCTRGTQRFVSAEYPKIFCAFNFWLKTPNRSTCVSSHKHTFRKLGNNLRNHKWNSSVLPNVSRWVPLLDDSNTLQRACTLHTKIQAASFRSRKVEQKNTLVKTGERHYQRTIIYPQD